MAVISLWTPLAFERIAERWFAWPNILFLWPVPIATAILACGGWHGLNTGREYAVPCAVGLFLLGFLGLAISNVPYLVPPSITVWDTAAVPQPDLHAHRRAHHAADDPRLYGVRLLDVPGQGARRRGISLSFRLATEAKALPSSLCIVTAPIPPLHPEQRHRHPLTPSSEAACSVGASATMDSNGASTCAPPSWCGAGTGASASARSRRTRFTTSRRRASVGPPPVRSARRRWPRSRGRRAEGRLLRRRRIARRRQQAARRPACAWLRPQDVRRHAYHGVPRAAGCAAEGGIVVVGQARPAARSRMAPARPVARGPAPTELERAARHRRRGRRAGRGGAHFLGARRQRRRHRAADRHY